MKYKIFTSEDGDWYVAAKRDGDVVSVLYEGHGRVDALDAIIKDAGVRISTVCRDMSTGSYEPKVRDWR